MPNYNWGTFSKRINIQAPVENIYEMWATSAGIEKWFLRRCEITNERGVPKHPEKPFMIGDHYLWRWHGWPDEVKEEGTILEANGHDKIKFTFGQIGAENMVCSVTIYTEGEETICEISQENIPDDEKGKTYYHIGCMTGWSFYLANLKSILEGGIDLRNKNEQLKNVINS
ncbi:MAG: SRPBCC domain-containing protein [Ferruginibacter sp.]|nr:SRPBCC domain-containing protein [Ferruginibacter sp.]